MRVQNMTNRNGRQVLNQFILFEEARGANGNFIKRETFQSYNSVIAIKTTWSDSVKIEIDSLRWDYSRTTGKYRNQFLGETKKETQRKIDSGEYKLVNLN